MWFEPIQSCLATISRSLIIAVYFFFFQAEDGIRDSSVTGVQTCALPISISSGTWPPKSCITPLAAPTSDFDLLRKNPVGRMSGSSSSGFNAAKAAGVGYFLNNSGVTLLTVASVHCAERIVATSNSQAL